MRKIDVEPGTFSDVKVVIWDNDRQSQALHLAWDELDAITAGASNLRRPTLDSGLTEQDQADGTAAFVTVLIVGAFLLIVFGNWS